MLPGMGALRSEYRFLSPAIAEAGFRAVAADLRGHGDSDPIWSDYSLPAVGRDILALIDHLSAGPAHLIGTSLSAGAAVWAAAERPNAIRSLTLIGAFVRDPKPSLGQKLALALLLRGPWKVGAWATYYKSLYPSKTPADFDEYLRDLKSNLKERGRFRAVVQLGSATKRPAEERLPRAGARTLVVMGTKDPDWPDPEAEARFISKTLSGQLILVDGAGHYPQTEMPEVVIPAILEFLRDG